MYFRRSSFTRFSLQHTTIVLSHKHDLPRNTFSIIIIFLLFFAITGTHYLLAQIILADLISLVQIKWELFYVNNRSWLEAIQLCKVYLGVDAFTSTAVMFFIIALNLHTISTYNLACRTIAKNNAKLLQRNSVPNNESPISTNCDDSETDDTFDDEDDHDADYDDDVDSDCDSVKPANGKSIVVSIERVHIEHESVCQRAIVIDYSKPKSQIYVLWPIIFIWLLAASTSIPMFLYGRIIPNLSRNSSERMCGILQTDPDNTILIQVLLIKVRIIVPIVCLVLSTIYVIHKLRLAKKRLAKPLIINAIIDEDAVQILKLAAALTLLFLVCSMQRIVGSLWFELISRPMMEYKYAAVHRWLGVAGCMLHYAAIFVRPMVYWYFERILWIDLKRGWC